MVESIQPTSWKVAGVEVVVQPTTEIKDVIQVGDLAKVHARNLDDGSIAAREIELAAGDRQAGFEVSSITNSNNSFATGGGDTLTMNGLEIEFYGIVEAMDDNVYTITGRQVVITPGTEIKDVIQIGDEVKVHAYVTSDGSLAAREIELAQTDGNSADDESNDQDDNKSGSQDDDPYHDDSDDDGYDDKDDDDDDDDDDED
jgi:hypothetical protein